MSAKWFGGILGWIAGGPLGALAGYALGSLFDSGFKVEYQQGNNNSDPTGYSPKGGQQSRNPQGERNSFLFSLLVMASYIIKADGKVMHSEMEYVRSFLRTNFGTQAVTEGEQILRNLFEQQKRMNATNPYAFRQTISECGAQIAANMSYEQRLQLLSFLASIAKADGSVCDAEVAALREVAAYLRMQPNEVDSILNLGNNTVEAAYKVLEVEPTATDAEVRAAYRKLALKHHPDRVATLGEDVKKAAEQKFQEINNAKEIVYKARGMK